MPETPPLTPTIGTTDEGSVQACASAAATPLTMIRTVKRPDPIVRSSFGPNTHM